MTSENNGGREKDASRSDGKKLFRFDDLPPRIRKNVERQKWTEPMPVQEKVIPLLLDGRDTVVQSRTGSGKTAAFAIPFCLCVDPKKDDVQSLVLVPTRELAEQVHGVCRELLEGTGIRSVAVYGGTAYGPQLDAFKKNVHVIVGTPGRIIDHLQSGRVSFKRLRFLVLDEADEMLSMGFYQSIMRILTYVPDKRQTALFSATISPGVSSLAQRFTRDPEPVTLSGDTLHVEEVDHVYYMADAMYKDRALLKIIEMENPEAALIFCNTKREVEYLGVFLQNFGYDGDYLSGDLSQNERDRVMGRIREGKLRYLVATDVAARGIDLSELGTVILYNLPQAHEHYIHRAGRTGRAGHGGTAISLVSIIEEGELKKRAERYGIKLIKKEIPTDEEVEKRVAERLNVMLEEKYRGLSNLEKERLGRFIPLARSLAGNAESHEITAMLFDRFYQETLHTPLYPRDEAPVEKERTPARRERSDGRRQESGKRGGTGRRPPRGGGRRRS